MKKEIILITALLTIILIGLSIFYYNHIQEKKEHELTIELRVCTMEYEETCNDYKEQCIGKIDEIYTTDINVDELINEIAVKANILAKSCFNKLFLKFDEKDIFETFRKINGIEVNTKNEFIRFYANLLASDIINEITLKIAAKELLQKQENYE